MMIFAKTTDYDSFVQDMKALSEGFVIQDEQGDILLHYTHDWSIHYIGKMVKVPAVIDEDGNVTTPAEFWDGERANIVPHEHFEQTFLDMMPSTVMANGTSFTEVAPVTPNNIFAGQDIEVDDSKVDKEEEAFTVGKKVQAGKVFTLDGQRYKVVIPHTTQADWSPDIQSALFVNIGEVGGVTPNWSDFASHEFQQFEIGFAVMDEGTTYYLIDQGQGYRKPSGQFGHFGWSDTKPE